MFFFSTVFVTETSIVRSSRNSPSPISNVEIYAYIVSLVSPVPASITRCLLEGCRNRVVCNNHDIRKIIPLELDAPSHQLWEFDTDTGEALPLIDPAQLSFRVSAGEWAVSPTGEHVVFLSAEDESLWLIDLPPDG